MKIYMYALALSMALITGKNALADGSVLPTVREVDKVIVDVLSKRRVNLSDRVSAYTYNPFKCAGCHANWKGNSMPILYGNSNFSKDQWQPAIGTLKTFKWEKVPEHDGIFKKGMSMKDRLEKSE